MDKNETTSLPQRDVTPLWICWVYRNPVGQTDPPFVVKLDPDVFLDCLMLSSIMSRMNFLDTRLGDKIKKITTKISVYGQRSETYVSRIETDDEGTYIYLGNKDRVSEGGYQFHKLKIFILPNGELKYKPTMENKFGQIHTYNMKIVESIIFTLDYWDSENDIDMENLQTVQVGFQTTGVGNRLINRTMIADYCRIEPQTRIFWTNEKVQVIECNKTILSLPMTYDNYLKNFEKLKDQRIRNFL